MRIAFLFLHLHNIRLYIKQNISKLAKVGNNSNKFLIINNKI